MAHRQRRKVAGFRTESGAVKVQVLLHPTEYAQLAKGAARARASLSAFVRAKLFGYDTMGRKYQPRGFAKA